MPFWLQATTTKDIVVFLQLSYGSVRVPHCLAGLARETKVLEVVARGGMTTLFGAWADLGSYNTINSILARFNVTDAVWQSVIAHLGDPGNDVALFSALPHTAILAACGLAQTDFGPLTPLQATQVGLVWRMSRRVLAFRGAVAEADFSDVDLWAVQDKSPPEPPVKNPQGTSGLKESVLKMSTIIDQCDDSELLPPDEVKLNQWIHAYISVMGAAPEESEEPTGAQLAALHKRVLVNMSAPYTDFAIWTPFGRRMSKIHKARVYTPLGNGSYLYKDLPGPASFQAWTSSWKVFKTACLMLNIVNLAALEAYYRTIERMVIQYPKCWGLIYSADDTARAEKLEKIKRHLTFEASVGRQVPQDWDPGKPWSTVFMELTRDITFWSERVHHPAAAWIAEGSRGAPTVATEQAVINHLPGGEDLQESGEVADPGNRKRQANRDKRAAVKKRRLQEREELRNLRQSQSSGGAPNGKGKSKGKSGGKSKDQSGAAICFSWASGSGPCGKLPPGAECAGQVKRVHKCRKCLSPSHQDDSCPG